MASRGLASSGCHQVDPPRPFYSVVRSVTRGWQRYELVIDVPEDAGDIAFGATMTSARHSALAQVLPRSGAKLSRIGTIGVLFLVALGISSCNGECSGTYNCPNLTMSISLPADISARVRSATGDTCTLILNASDGSIGVTSTTMHPCVLRVVLDDGSIEESTVTFVQLQCCGYTVQGTPFEPADAG